MKKPKAILAGDIGGTKTLLGIYLLNEDFTKIYQKRYLSSEWNSLYEILNDFLEKETKALIKPFCGCIAVAGQVKNNQAQLTNLPWIINEQDICSKTKIKNIELINDFAVLIYGLPFLRNNQIEIIQSSKVDSSGKGPIALLGAGTGLGVARGIKLNGQLIAIPSEGGHCEFSPRDEKEWALSKWLKADLKLERLSVERIVSGTGLGHIARWQLHQAQDKDHPLWSITNNWNETHGTNKSSVDLPQLACKAAEEGDLLMKEAIKIWLNAYGSAAGDLALKELCTGGLWIGGGTARKHLKGIRSETFLNSFSNKGRFKSFLKGIPINALVDPEANLFSAACRARILAEQMGD